MLCNSVPISFFRMVLINLSVCLYAHIQFLGFLYKKGLSVVTKLHVQLYWLSIHFDVNLEELNKS